MDPALALVPDDARPALGEYLAALDATVPGQVSGVYVTGSIALGDWQPGRSDIDILTVTNHELREGELAALEAMHAAMPGQPYRDAVYIPAAAVGTRPDPDFPGYPSAVDGVFAAASDRPDPVLWATLDGHGVTVRGPAANALGAAPDPRWLREWNLGNLESYWRPLAAGARSRWADANPASSVRASAIVWGALGPGRLHATIGTGEIISKTAAADYTAGLFPEYAPLLAAAKAFRLGDDSLTFTVADMLAVCNMADAVIDHAATLSAP